MSGDSTIILKPKKKLSWWEIVLIVGLFVLWLLFMIWYIIQRNAIDSFKLFKGVDVKNDTATTTIPDYTGSLATCFTKCKSNKDCAGFATDYSDIGTVRCVFKNSSAASNITASPSALPYFSKNEIKI